jgi:hypothetical protein
MNIATSVENNQQLAFLTEKKCVYSNPPIQQPILVNM